jgi:LytR cell envelope-related transcriptional attenuator
MSQGHEHAHQHDRFDEVHHSKRVGAHRAPRGPYIGGLVVAIVAVLILVSAGVVGIAVLNAGNQFHDTAAAASSTAATSAGVTAKAPAKKITISVLNGTDTTDLASTVTKRLKKRGWTGVLSPASASTTSITATHVYYAKKKLAGYAQGVADDLKSATIVKTDKYSQFGAKLVVVVGSDYVAAAAK